MGAMVAWSACYIHGPRLLASLALFAAMERGLLTETPGPRPRLFGFWKGRPAGRRQVAVCVCFVWFVFLWLFFVRQAVFCFVFLWFCSLVRWQVVVCSVHVSAGGFWLFKSQFLASFFVFWFCSLVRWQVHWSEGSNIRPTLLELTRV